MDRPISLEARRIDLRTEPPFTLGRASVDPSAHEFVIGDSATRVQPQTLKVLVALHDKMGEVVTRDELVDRCWDGRIVGEDVINRSISLLRRLADKNGGFRIETVPRAGYRLVDAPHKARPNRNHAIIAGVAAAAAALGAAVLVLGPLRQAPQSATLAVTLVPFAVEHDSRLERQLAADTDHSVARMLTESGFSVTTGNAKSAPPSDLVVTGQIGSSGGLPAGTVNVEDVHRHVIILSHELKAVSGHSDDLPDQIGANVAGSLSWADRLLQLDEKHPSDPAVISQMLDQFSNEDFDFWRTYEFASRHAPLAPDSALAQWQLAMVTGLLIHGMPQADRPAAIAAARAAADRAQALEPRVGDFRIPWCMLHAQVRIAECEGRLREALKVDPQAAWTPSFLGNLLNSVGRTDEAEMLDSSSLAEDVYAPSKIAQALIMFEAAGHSEHARSVYQRGARLWPNTHFLLTLRIQGITQRGDFAALQRLPQEIGRANLPDYYGPVLPIARAVTERSIPAARAGCPKQSLDRIVAMCMIAFAQLGDLDDAFAYADEVYPRRLGRSVAEDEKLWFADEFVLSTAFLTGKGAAPMRRDPRYLALAQRLGLLDYWRHNLPDFCTKAREPICALISARP
jgi:DNA-binding winged helix-turn-helix (wHTH) protein/tetratricopeptide (TPR) repeat protein